MKNLPVSVCLLLGFDSRAIQLRGVRAASSHRLDGVGEGMKREAASGARAASSHRLDGVGDESKHAAARSAGVTASRSKRAAIRSSGYDQPEMAFAPPRLLLYA